MRSDEACEELHCSVARENMSYHHRIAANRNDGITKMNGYWSWLGTMLVILLTAVTIAGIAEAQTSLTPADLQEEEKLEREFTDAW
ncbi:MAG: hypothetical protein JO121_19170 [Deltaproteobacteria bacterium]|nr:hypothetical protein [Deltaproteobacteria bacterium]